MQFFKRKVSFFDQPIAGVAKRNFQLDFLGASLFSMFNVVFNQFYIAMALREGATHLQVGLLSAAPAIGLLLSPIWASLIEGRNPKPFVIFPNLIARSLILWPAFFSDPSVFVTIAPIIQLLNGIQAPAYASLIAQIYPSNIRGRLLGYVRLPMVLIMIPLAFYVGQWMDISGSSGPLIAASICGVLSILGFFWLKPIEGIQVRKADQKRASARDQWQLIKENRVLALFLAATTLSGFANMLCLPLYQIIQVEQQQLSNMELAYARIAYYVFLLLAYLVIGWAIDRLPIQYTLLSGMIAYAIVPTLYGFFGDYYPTIIIGSAVQGLGDAIWDIGMLAFILRIVPGREGVVYGLHLLLFGIRGTIGPLLSTNLSDLISLPLMLLFSGGIAIMGILIFMFGYRHSKQSPR